MISISILRQPFGHLIILSAIKYTIVFYPKKKDDQN